MAGTTDRETAGLAAALATIVGDEWVLPVSAAYLQDAAGALGLRPRADAVVLPGCVDEVAAVVAWCAERGVPVTPRGGGTGLAGGAVPLHGGIVLGLERLRRVRQFDPLLWRIEVDAGLSTADVQRLARENGLLFPPDPGAAEDSQIGGNVATNAGGPHAFKYGVTGAWVTGLEVVFPNGEIVTLGGTARKDAAGLDLKGLLIGSEGTLGIITGAALRLIPHPVARHGIAAFFPDAAAGAAGLEAALASGVVPAALDYLDRGALAAVASTYPGAAVPDAGFVLLAEVDGHSDEEAAAGRTELLDALGGGALRLDEHPEVGGLWRWRDTVSGAVASLQGAKLSEDVVVPLDSLATAVDAVVALGIRHGVSACSWGHAGDGNLHASFLLDSATNGALASAQSAAHELFDVVVDLGGSVSGEHGIGVLKRDDYLRLAAPGALEAQRAVKAAIDPTNLMNPGKVI